MAKSVAKANPPWRPWATALLFLTSAKPGAGGRLSQNQIHAAWSHTAVQQQQGPRNASNDANFLIQATFGPTRESLQELAGLTYSQWIDQQMAVPPELHRSHYRQRVNPRQTAPMPAGSVRSRCAVGSRWHNFAVERIDVNKRIEVRDGQLRVGDELRTEIDPKYVGNGLQPLRCSNEPLAAWRGTNGVLTRNCTRPPPSTVECSSEAFVREGACAQACFDLATPVNDADCSTWANLTFDGFVCDAVDGVGGLVRLSSGLNCKGTLRVLRNPAVWFARAPSSTATPRRFRGVRPGVLLLAETPANCDLGDIVQVESCDVGVAGVCQPSQFARHSARLELLRNTPEAPAASAGAAATLCPTVRRNPFNIGSCRVQPACTPGWSAAVNIVLTPASVSRLSNISGRSVYSVAGLAATTPPCRRPSRWAALDCTATNGSRCVASALSATQAQAVQAALQAASGDFRDVFAACDDVPAGAVVQLGTAFFQQVHADEGNVYDFTDWAKRDPAGAAAILRLAVGSALQFPAAFNTSGWAAVSPQLVPALLGRIGGAVDFSALPLSLQLLAVANAFQQRVPTQHYEVCGSPGEVANDPSQGHWYTFFARVSGAPVVTWQDPHFELPPPNSKARVNVWLQKAMYGKDQLRQRVAWALSQIFVHGDDGYSTLPERKLAFYDIFVRNAFGNFRDVLREVTYSPMMGNYLTYVGNKAFHVQATFPDENYAREVMQLFTIGLWQLHPNGTSQRASNGEAVPTYSNLHIQNFARVFTGLTYEAPRSNYEQYFSTNVIDPMRMNADWHDRFPKTDLADGYLGDGYPLCTDLPGNAFLRQGARFEFAGFQPPVSSRDIFSVNTSSPLYQELCQPGTPEAPTSAACNFKTVVELQRSVACHGDQCSWELPRVLLVGGGYYAFVPPPCVRLFFFNGRQLLENGQLRECADPATVAGGVACCSNRSTSYPASCVASGRDVRLSIAEARCASLNMTTCGLQSAGQRPTTCSGKVWSNQSCRLSVAIDADGRVSPQTDAASKVARFPVVWARGFPTPSAQSCADEGCAFANSSCICEATVETAAVFNRVPSEQEVRSLRVGAFPPTERCTACSGPVRAYSAGSGIDASTVFEVAGRFWRNLQSTVRVGRQRFRNPPNFMVPGSPRVRDALNEVDAFLDLLVRHPNTPVFTSYRLIQRFGNSNPSARYLEDVAQAFRTGRYAGRNYSGRYGDLSATVAAILLHPEARAGSLLQAGALREPALKYVHLLRSLEYRDRFGRPLFVNDGLAAAGQEPVWAPSVFNFYHFDFQPSHFLQSDALRALMAPEYEIMDSTQLVSLINGLASATANAGLSHCNGGFGVSAGGSLSALQTRVSLCQQGDFLAMGRLNASTVDAALSELSLLLTGGRLSQSSMDTVRASYQADFGGPYYDARLGGMLPGSTTYRNLSAALVAALNEKAVGGVTQGQDGLFTLRTNIGTGPVLFRGEVSWVKKATAAAKFAAAQAAMVLTPEFNTVGGRVGSRPSPQTTSTPEPAPASLRPYKALVQLFLSGGADTFQLIVPQNCPLYGEYVSVRGSVALTPSQLHQVTTANQACGNFGVHNKLPFLAELYRSGEAAFASNVGSLVEPLLGRQDFLAGGKRRCAGLFSHFDQVKGANTLVCQSSAAQLGAGGRLADALAADPLRYRATSFSLIGRSAWSDGNKIKPRSLSPSIGVPQILDIDGLQGAIANITGRAYESIYGDIYVRGLADIVSQSEEMGRIMDAVKLNTTNFPIATGLQQQFYQVARVIASRAERRAERDFFAVRIGGFDTHKSVNPTLDKNFAEIDGALKAFVDELKAQGVWNSTVVFTASDFGRTLTPNDNTEEAGTDHAWAGNHMVLGGAIRGGRVFNDYPSALQLGSAMDLGRGLLIPKYPYESFMVPVAQWMGLSEDQLGAAFPNLPNFNRSAHILTREALFRG